MKFPKLDENSLHLRVYSDYSFEKNFDLTSQIGNIVLLCDTNNACHILHYTSKKCKRAVPSVLAAETFDLYAAFDY